MLTACSSASTPPLGGPFGGVAANQAPAGTANPADSGSFGSTSGASPSDSGAAEDAGSASAPSPLLPDGAPSPTWTELWTEYMNVGTVGGCAKVACHSGAAECGGASDCYNWLNSLGYIGGGINNNDLFTWTPDGFMPQGGPTSDPSVLADFAAWTAAGSLNN